MNIANRKELGIVSCRVKSQPLVGRNEEEEEEEEESRNITRTTENSSIQMP